LTRVNTPTDRDSKARKDHTYVVMSSPDIADRLANSGLNFAGEKFEARTLPDQATVDLIGVTKRAIVSVSVSDGVSIDEALEAATAAAGMQPVQVCRLVFLVFLPPINRLSPLETSSVLLRAW
jgi:hypothetical protein